MSGHTDFKRLHYIQKIEETIRRVKQRGCEVNWEMLIKMVMHDACVTRRVAKEYINSANP